MPSFYPDYVLLKYKLLATIKSQSSILSLDEVKNEYRGVIKSERRLSDISDFVALLSVLEKRGHIGDHSVAALRSLARKVNDAELDYQMSRYEENLTNHQRTYKNCYALGLESARASFQGVGSTFSGSMQSSSISLPSNFTFSRNLDVKEENNRTYESVIDLICCEIGKQWMELARKLSLREGEIDSINIKYPNDLTAKVREMLHLFTKRTDPEKWQLKLLDGLVQARRKDLKERVEELLMRRTR